MKNNIAKFGLMLVAIIWGSGFIATQMALDSGLTPNQIMTLRFFASALLMTLIFFKHLKSVNKETLLGGIFIGIFLFIAFSFQTYGLMHTTPSKNAFITATNVIIVPFIGFLIYKRKLDTISIVSSFIAIVGIGILSLDSNFNINIGDALTLICAIGFAMHIFITGEYSKKCNPIALTTIQLTTAFVLSLLLLIFTKETNIKLNYNGVYSTLYLAVFSTTIAFLLQTVCQTKATQNETAIILSTESIFGTIFSAIILREVITLKMFIGCVLIFLAIIMAETKLSFLKKYKSEKEALEITEE